MLNGILCTNKTQFVGCLHIQNKQFGLALFLDAAREDKKEHSHAVLRVLRASVLLQSTTVVVRKVFVRIFGCSFRGKTEACHESCMKNTAP